MSEVRFKGIWETSDDGENWTEGGEAIFVGQETAQLGEPRVVGHWTKADGTGFALCSGPKHFRIRDVVFDQGPQEEAGK